MPLRGAAWTHADRYKVIVGGIRFRDVRHPLVLDGKELLKFERHESGKLAVSFELRDVDGNRIATIHRNHIVTFDEKKYSLRNSTDRTSLVEIATGKVLCEICIPAFDNDYEMDVAFITYAKKDFPILMHPNRMKIGPVKPDSSPDLMGLTLTTEFGSGTVAVTIDHRPYYVLDVAAENFAAGFRILANGADNMNVSSGIWVR